MILHTEREGKGDAVLLIHSGLQTGKTDFVHLASELNQSFFVIRPDLRGHGRSKSNDINNFFEDSADDLAQTLAHLEVHKIHVIGSSLGGLVAMTFAKKFPHLINSLTLSGVKPVKPSNWSLIHQSEVDAQAQLLTNQESVEYFDHLHQSDWCSFLKMAKDEAWYPFQKMNNIVGIKAPIFIIVGEGMEDEVRGALYYQGLSKHVRIAIVPFASHLVQAQQPELYTKLMQTFLAGINKRL